MIKAEHTGVLPGNPSYAWIKRIFFIFVHRLPAPSVPDHSLGGGGGGYAGGGNSEY